MFGARPQNKTQGLFDKPGPFESSNQKLTPISIQPDESETLKKQLSDAKNEINSLNSKIASLEEDKRQQEVNPQSELLTEPTQDTSSPKDEIELKDKNAELKTRVSSMIDELKTFQDGLEEIQQKTKQAQENWSKQLDADAVTFEKELEDLKKESLKMLSIQIETSDHQKEGESLHQKVLKAFNQSSTSTAEFWQRHPALQSATLNVCDFVVRFFFTYLCFFLLAIAGAPFPGLTNLKQNL